MTTITTNECLPRLAGSPSNLRYTPILSEPRAPTARRVGMLTHAIAADPRSCAGARAYIAEPPAMVEAAIQIFLCFGMTRADIHTDFSPLMASCASGRPRGPVNSREPIAAASSGT